MAYTASDLASVETALLALAKGELVAEATIDGETVKYSQTNIDALRQMRSMISAELAQASSTMRHMVVKTSKGL